MLRQPGSASSAVETPQNVKTETTITKSVITPLPTETPLPPNTPPTLSFSPAIPEELIDLVRQIKGVNIQAQGDYILEPRSIKPDGEQSAEWLYAVVAPFPTVVDGLSMQDLVALWKGDDSAKSEFHLLLMTADTLAGFSELWGEPEDKNIRIANSGELLDLAWAQKNSLAIIPFESISPRWKVLRIDKMSPLDPKLDSEQYPLKIYFIWQSRKGGNTTMVQSPPILPVTNRELDKLTTVILTGTTALARETAAKMEEKGVDYPAGDIADWLKSADITHISNEVSFYEKCPPAIPVRKEMRFCSNPKYIELFDAVGADVIESTGNHILDWGYEPFLYTLGLYKEHGFQYYGGGINLDDASKPLIIEHNGTRLAFIGCNIAGPDNVWATSQSAGAAPCDLDWMADEVKQLHNQGILPIVTFQHYEVDDYNPMNLTRQHFQLMADAGAVIVSGSQAHFPHGFAFSNDTFMHYGLGNLFFDQMFEGNRREFIDRHVFYNGHYLGVELLTAILEDYSHPRPMNTEERAQMLSTYFQVSGW